MAGSVPIFALLLTGAFVGQAHAQPELPEERRSRSVGQTNAGRLLNARRLSPSPALRVRSPANAHGTDELVSLLEWAAAQVAAQHPGASLLVGDLSRRSGGRLRPHRSHRVGRDADVSFYLLDEAGNPARTRHFVHLRADGTGTDRHGNAYRFDVVRNWALVAHLMGQDVVPVQYVMVIRPLKEMLIAEGERQGAPVALLERVREAVGPRTTGRGRWARYGTHDSHFHVRVYCDEGDRPRCRDAPPFWAWISAPPPGERARPSRSRRRRSSAMRAGRTRGGARSARTRGRSRNAPRRGTMSSMARTSMRSSSMRSSSMRSSSMRSSSMGGTSMGGASMGGASMGRASVGHASMGRASTRRRATSSLGSARRQSTMSSRSRTMSSGRRSTMHRSRMTTMDRGRSSSSR